MTAAEKKAAREALAPTPETTSTNPNIYQIEATGMGKDGKYWAKITRENPRNFLEETAFLRSKRDIFEVDAEIDLTGVKLSWEA